METSTKPENQLEVWMRGPIANIPDLLQPVAHAILQMQEEVHKATKNLNETLLWQKPAGVASVGFHILHISGVIDRMFTYANNESLSESQFDFLKAEKEIHTEMSLEKLLAILDKSVSDAIQKLKNTDVSELTNVRYLGRKRIPTTLIGLLFHSAEHSMRHLGQLLVTIRILNQSN